MKYTEQTKLTKREKAAVEQLLEACRGIEPFSLHSPADEPDTRFFLAEEEGGGAAYGSLMHRFLARAPYPAAPMTPQDTVAFMLSGAAAAGLFTPQELARIRRRDILRFLESDVGQRMRASARVERELRFNLLLPELGGRLLQGVIDLCFLREDGAWVLVDYKTDRASPEELDLLVRRYAGQVNWYARALAALTGQPVAERWLYHLGTGRALPVAAEA